MGAQIGGVTVTHLRLLKPGVLTAAALLIVLTWAQTVPPAAEAILQDTDGDGASDIGEELAGSDPNDPDSFPESTAAQFLSRLPLCNDGIDNDGDGLIDDDDPHCTDSDADIISDPTEQLLGSDPNDVASFPEDARLDAALQFHGGYAFCGDGIDNDGDGLADGDDPGCAALRSDADGFDDATEKTFGSDPANPESVPEHEAPNPGSCSDGIDNDLDGLTDGADPACGTPSNDGRAGATAIPALPFTDGPLMLENATTENGEPRSDCSYDGPVGTVWYTFTAAEDARLIADTAGSNFGPRLAVWRGDGATLIEVTCADGAGPAGEARVVFETVAGETYLFQIDKLDYNPHPRLAFNVGVGVAPANDDFVDATNIQALPFTDSLDVSAANTEPGEYGCPYTFADSSVWYAYTPPEDVFLVAESKGSSFVPVLAAWRETGIGLEQVSCGRFRLGIDAEAGITYYFQLSRYPRPSEPTGFDATFSLEVGVPPANDNFAAATVVSSLPFTDTVDPLAATTEPDEPLDCQLSGKHQTVWYQFAPPADTFVVADTAGSDPSLLVIALYHGSSLSHLELFACARPSSPETHLGIKLDGGQTYFFQVGLTSSGLPSSGLASAGSELAQDRPAIAGLPSGSGGITFNLDHLDVPDCPPPGVPVSDPMADGLPFRPRLEGAPDIIAVGTSSTGDWSCLTVEFTAPIDTYDAETDASFFATLAFDTDLDVGTGFGNVTWLCSRAALGFEVTLRIHGGSGILLAVSSPIGNPGLVRFERQFAIALFAERSFTVAVPLDALGGDGDYTYAVVAGGPAGVSDCAPNVGVIRAPAPAEIGDVNCDGERNALDSVLMLQSSARLKLSVPCQNVADVNQSGAIDPIDALLVLQYDAGLLSHLP